MNISNRSTPVTKHLQTGLHTTNSIPNLLYMLCIEHAIWKKETERGREQRREKNQPKHWRSYLLYRLCCSDLAERVISIRCALNSTKPLPMHSNASRKVSQQRGIHRDLDEQCEHTLMHLALKYESVRLFSRTLHTIVYALCKCVDSFVCWLFCMYSFSSLTLRDADTKKMLHLPFRFYPALWYIHKHQNIGRRQ